MTAPTHHGIATENWPRCWACSRPAPKQNNNQTAGWVGRWTKIAGVGLCREYYCADCFREHGWPDWERIDREWERNNAGERA